MMHTANVPIDEHSKVAIEAIKNATQLNGLHVVTINDITQTRDEHMFGLLPKWAKAMRTWGKAGVVKEEKQ
jgi:preprotein translocase subunit SecA